MKRLWISIVLICLVLCSCFLGYNKLNTITQDLSQDIQQVNEFCASQGFSEAHNKLQQVHLKWQQEQPLLGAIVRHNELDDIENLFLRAMQSLENQDMNEYYLQSSELNGMILHLLEMEKPNIQNIF